jgi:predicted N-acyltransferase
MVEIIIANEKNASDWDRIVDNSNNSTLFHKWEWLKTVEKYTKTTFYPLMASDMGTPIGIFPLFVQKRFFVKSLFSPPPQAALPYLGPIMKFKEEEREYTKESLFIEFCSKVIEFISSKIKPNYTSFVFSPGMYDMRPFIWAGYEVAPYYCYYMDISKTNPNHILSQLKKNLRNGINRAIRFGVTIREGGEHELDAIYGLMERRYDEQDKLVTVNKQYLQEIYSKFKKNIRISVAEYNGEIITGIVDLHYNNKIASWIGNPKPETRHINANDLLNWMALKWACDNGLKRYEQIGAAGVPRLYSFYSKFNFELLLCLTAKKYSSPVFKIMENTYTNVIKPTKAKLKK